MTTSNMRQVRRLASVAFILFIFCPMCQTKPVADDNTTEEMGDETASLKVIERDVVHFVSDLTKSMLPFFVRNQERLNLSHACQDTLTRVFLDLRKLKMPAWRLLDAMAKPPIGLFNGVFTLMGDYDECLSIRANRKGYSAAQSEAIYYQGQYCTLGFKIPQALTDGFAEYAEGKKNLSDFGKLGSIIQDLPLSATMRQGFDMIAGICVPSTCNDSDINSLLKLISKSYLGIEVKRCMKSEETTYKVDQIIIVTLLSSLAAIAVISTCVEVLLYLQNPRFKERKQGKLVNFFMTFSMYSNTQKWMQPDRNNDARMKGASIFCIFIEFVFHSYYNEHVLLTTRNLANIQRFAERPIFSLLATQPINIDSFFLISGFFLVFGRFKKNSKKVEINIIKTILRRFMRLFPSWILIIAIIMILPLIGSGPVWNDVIDVKVDNTRKWWWLYVIMGNNFLLFKDQSFAHMWFVPSLMQITVLGVLLTWILTKNRKLGLISIVVVALVANLILGILTVVNDYPPLFSMFHAYDRVLFERTLYTSPLSHIAPFCIGMLFGFYSSSCPSIKFPKIIAITIGLFSVFMILCIQILPYSLRHGGKWSPLYTGLYAACHKSLFAISMACILTLIGNYGSTGAVGKIFRWSPFGLVNKLLYLVYLLHYIMIMCDGALTRTYLLYEEYNIWRSLPTYMLCTLFLAYLFHITYEIPISYLEQKLFPRKTVKALTSKDTEIINGHIKQNGIQLPEMNMEK